MRVFGIDGISTLCMYIRHIYMIFLRGRSAELCQIASSLIVSRFSFIQASLFERAAPPCLFFLLHPCSFLLYHMCGTGWYIFFFVGSWYLYSTSCLSTCWVNQFSPEILGRSLRVKLIQSCIPWTLPIFRSGFKKCAVYSRVHYVDVHVYRPVYNHNI